MSSPFSQAITIDTNVFLRFVNKSENTDGHITAFLRFLLLEKTQLVVDEDGRILSEYQHHIIPAFRAASVKNFEVHQIRYWLDCITNRRNLKKVEVDHDSLMNAIRVLVYEGDAATDCIFVYVAFKSQTTLVSNDRRNIVIGSARDKGGQRRDLLLRVARRHRLRGADILTSEEAHAKIPT